MHIKWILQKKKSTKLKLTVWLWGLFAQMCWAKRQTGLMACHALSWCERASISLSGVGEHKVSQKCVFARTQSSPCPYAPSCFQVSRQRTATKVKWVSQHKDTLESVALLSSSLCHFLFKMMEHAHTGLSSFSLKSLTTAIALVLTIIFPPHSSS